MFPKQVFVLIEAETAKPSPDIHFGSSIRYKATLPRDAGTGQPILRRGCNMAVDRSGRERDSAGFRSGLRAAGGDLFIEDTMKGIVPPGKAGTIKPPRVAATATKALSRLSPAHATE